MLGLRTLISYETVENSWGLLLYLDPHQILNGVFLFETLYLHKYPRRPITMLIGRKRPPAFYERMNLVYYKRFASRWTLSAMDLESKTNSNKTAFGGRKSSFMIRAGIMTNWYANNGIIPEKDRALMGFFYLIAARRSCMKHSLTIFFEAPPRFLADPIALIVPREVVLLLVILRVRENRVVVVVGLVLRLPSHLVLFLEAPPRVGEPSRDLRQRHLRDNRQHDFLALRRVRVLLVLVQPGLQGRRRLPRRVLPPRG